MLVVDASVAVGASWGEDGFLELAREDLVAPPLMWTEARSALHELQWRGEISADDALAAHARLEHGPIEERRHRRLGSESWHVADQLGWAKTYDAEYVALARLLDCRLLTLDRRLRRAAERVVAVIHPDEL